MLEVLNILYVALLAAPTWVAANPVQVLGTLTGVAGALLLALRCRYSSWAWPVWIISNAAWSWYAFTLPEVAYGLIAQQLVFGVINLIGTWTWMFRRETMAAVNTPA